MSLTNEFRKYATKHMNINADAVDHHLKGINNLLNN